MAAEESLRNVMSKKATYNEIKTSLKNSVAHYIYRKTERNPMIIPLIMSVNDNN
jgi:mRNA degradation ribonuclease J1/J2